LTHLDAFVYRLVLTVKDFLLRILFYLPAIARMNFLYVDDVEGHTVAKALVDAVEGPSLGPEWRSSVASEDQCYWAIPKVLGKALALSCVVGTEVG